MEGPVIQLTSGFWIATSMVIPNCYLQQIPKICSTTLEGIRFHHSQLTGNLGINPRTKLFKTLSFNVTNNNHSNNSVITLQFFEVKLLKYKFINDLMILGIIDLYLCYTHEEHSLIWEHFHSSLFTSFIVFFSFFNVILIPYLNKY